MSLDINRIYSVKGELLVIFELQHIVLNHQYATHISLEYASFIARIYSSGLADSIRKSFRLLKSTNNFKNSKQHRDNGRACPIRQ